MTHVVGDFFCPILNFLNFGENGNVIGGERVMRLGEGWRIEN